MSEPSRQSEVHHQKVACLVLTLVDSVQVHAAGPVPAPRGGHAAVSVGTKVIIYGGTDRQATPFTDLWMLETGETTLFLFPDIRVWTLYHCALCFLLLIEALEMPTQCSWRPLPVDTHKLHFNFRVRN